MPTVVCSCGKTIEVKPEWAGVSIRCRGCAAQISVPQSTEAAPEEPQLAASETRPCPFCAEQILKEAIKCRWCGRSLLVERAAPPAPPPVPTDNGGVWILVIAIIGWVIWCLGLVLHPVAWAAGAHHESTCRALGIEPGGAAKAGKILGMIGTILYGIGVLFFIVVGLAGSLA